jgi:DNA/RNA endonuclease YhcR with UshA esterase domain
MNQVRTRLAIFAAAVGLLVPLVPIAAHHSFAAEYDANKPVTIKGTVTKVEWTNPHARFYVDVKDANGKVTNWNFELASPNVLKRSGWSRTSLKEGDNVTVEGSAAKDGANMANARAVTLATGKRVFAGSSGGDGK